MNEVNNVLAETILEVWNVSDAINMTVGLDTSSEDQLEHQKNVAFSEYKEGMLAIFENNEAEKYDALIDLHVTVPTCLMMYSGNKDLLLEAPRGINLQGKGFNELLHLSQEAFLEEKDGFAKRYIDAVDYLVDATMSVDLDINKVISYAKAVNTSNTSKFAIVGTVDPELECDKIELKGRYDEVYFEEGELLGNKVYIFKSKYDKQTKEHFANGKYLKPSTFIDVQELL